MAQETCPTGIRRLHPGELGPADRIDERRDLIGDEEALAAMDREDEVPARAELAEPLELRRRPLPEAGALARVRLLVARLEEARQCRVGRPREEPAVEEELLRLVQRDERAIRGEPALA